MHQEKSGRCLLVFYMTELCKASLKVATMQQNISGILNVTKNLIPDPLLQTPLYWILLLFQQVWNLSGDNTLYAPMTYIILWIDFCWKFPLNLQYWLTDHIFSSLFNKCSVLLGTRQHLWKVGAGGKHSSRLKKVPALLHFMKGNLYAMSDIALRKLHIPPICKDCSIKNLQVPSLDKTPGQNNEQHQISRI